MSDAEDEQYDEEEVDEEEAEEPQKEEPEVSIPFAEHAKQGCLRCGSASENLRNDQNPSDLLVFAPRTSVFFKFSHPELGSLNPCSGDTFLLGVKGEHFRPNRSHRRSSFGRGTGRAFLEIR